jgi:AP2-associated kinase
MLQGKLAGHANIVQMLDHAQFNRNEVFIVMEYCAGSLRSILEQSRFHNEAQLYAMFAQVCCAVATMHTQDPPIAHRDIKVENVLVSGQTLKLCDFGSASTNHMLPQNRNQVTELEEDIAKNTTPLYRSPEMIDLYMHRMVDEKVDIWV